MKSSIHLKNQQGVALLVSLILLVAMTMLGISSMKGSSTELTMAGNLRESGLTFQAAEAGLRQAEAIVEDSSSSAMFDGTSPSLLSNTDADPDYLDKTSWDSATTTSISLAGIKTNPQYIIKYLGDWAQNPLALVNIGAGYGGQPPGSIISNFRSTSRGTGQTGNTARTVQSYYGKQYIN